jgi:hypothetical protein
MKRVRLLLLALLALLLAALFREALFEGEVLSQGDALYDYEPWRAVRPEGLVPGNPSLIDQISQFQPWLLHMQQRLAAGELPLWNGLSAGGQPFLGNMQSGVFSPFHLFAHLLPFGVALIAIALAKLMVAGFGTALLARRLGCSTSACVLAAVAYTLGGYQFLWLGHPHSGASAMLPLLLYLVERWCSSPTRWLRPGFALGVACLLFAGHVETALHVALAVGLYAVARSSERTLRERLALLGDITLWSLVGLAIAAVQMVPFAEYLALSEIFAKRVAFQDVWRGIPWGLTPWVLFGGVVVAGAVLVGRAAVRAADGRRWTMAIANGDYQLDLRAGDPHFSQGPMSISIGDTPLIEAIHHERKLLDPFSSKADLRLDTTRTNLHQLREMVIGQLSGFAEKTMLVLFESFGFKHGPPANADFVFDLRCLPNPHWVADLRPLTGRDQGVIDFLQGKEDVESMFADISHFLGQWMPRFEAENRSYLTIAVGCTGGQHRSVYMAERLRREFEGGEQLVQVRHRELS